MSAHDNLAVALGLLVIGLFALTAGLLFATVLLYVAMGISGLSVVFATSAIMRLLKPSSATNECG